MAKQKPAHHWSAGGDWTETGTFIRKPPTGWIHRDEDLTEGSEVRYRVAVSSNERRMSAGSKTVFVSCSTPVVPWVSTHHSVHAHTSIPCPHFSD